MKIQNISGITPAQLQAIRNYALNVLGVSVELIRGTWPCCKYRYMLHVDSKQRFYAAWELEKVLSEIFGAAEYFWDDTFLCELKK